MNDNGEIFKNNIPELPPFSKELERYWEEQVTNGAMSETEKRVHEKGILLIKVAAGSQSFGLATETSDVDIHGVYILKWSERIKHDAPSQIADEKNNEVYWDITKFLTELNSANPQALEMLYAPRHCVFVGQSILEILRKRFDFLTMRCDKSFCEYARGQVDRAKGLNKKVFDPQPKDRPRFVDFIYVLDGNLATPLMEWVKANYRGKPEEVQRWFSIARIEHGDCIYAMYFQKKPLSISIREFARKCLSKVFKGVRQLPEHKWRWGYGVVRDIERSDDIQLNSIPKGLRPVAHIFVNRNDFARKCKKWHEYWDWVKARNEERYNTTLKHGQGYDAKNIMHCVRLLLTAYGIATEHTVPVYRADRDLCNKVCMDYNKHPYSNDRDFLLAIKNGVWTFDDIIDYIGELGKEVNKAFAASGLKEKAYTPEEIDKFSVELATKLLPMDWKKF